MNENFSFGWRFEDDPDLLKNVQPFPPVEVKVLRNKLKLLLGKDGVT